MSAEAQTMYLTEKWWNSPGEAATLTNGNNLESFSISGGSATYVPCSVCSNTACTCWRTYYTPTYWWPTQYSRKIRLTLTEVEHLRKLAANDRKLRETMRKFSPHIEVEVDFPGDDKI